MDTNSAPAMELRNRRINKYNNTVLAKLNKLFDDQEASTPWRYIAQPLGSLGEGDPLSNQEEVDFLHQDERIEERGNLEAKKLADELDENETYWSQDFRDEYLEEPRRSEVRSTNDYADPCSAPSSQTSINTSLDNMTSALLIEEESPAINESGDTIEHRASPSTFQGSFDSSSSGGVNRNAEKNFQRLTSSPKEKSYSSPKHSGIGPKRKKPKKPSMKSLEAITKLLDEEPPAAPSDALSLIEEASLRLRETFALDELAEQREEKLRQSGSAIEAARQKAVAESARMAERIRVEMDESATREAVKKIAEYISDVWTGRCISWRYEAFRKGGAARRALFYRMITEPFTEAQIKWVLQEIELLHTPTEQERREHEDFVWKVVLAETLIKLYMEKFNLDKTTAERSIADTPIEDGDDHLWTSTQAKGSLKSRAGLN